ncbi:MAG: hypothetical protein K0R90_1330, partial [Oscillospiraceae bacterium]|nr:hypothetical protein [Oscillospiraceae bacterium]
NRKFDTPTLIEVWRTSPWLFNGKATNMFDTIKNYFAKDKGYTDAQIQNLTDYVLSIGAEGEIYGVERVNLTDKIGVGSYNVLAPLSTINNITLRRQFDTTKDATATFEFFDKNGTSLKKVQKDLDKSMSMDTAVTMTINYMIPVGVEAGAYLKVSITNRSNSSEKLATDYVIKYNG